MVDRYDPHAIMDQRKHGDWVSYDDYRDLESQLKIIEGVISDKDYEIKEMESRIIELEGRLIKRWSDE